MRGFTLAELLITLGIIGVVAAVVMPTLITNVQERVRAKRIENIQQKFSKATDKMLSVSGLNGYASTSAFVKELGNHLAIAKVCENNNLRACWPTEKVLLENDKEWEISKTTTGKTLQMKNSDTQEWDDTMGIVTADGTAMILSYNKKCEVDTNKTPTWLGSKSDSTNCVAAVYDWNGSAKPNRFGLDSSNRKTDVIAFNANGLGSACGIDFDGKCYSSPKFFSTYQEAAEHCGGSEKFVNGSNFMQYLMTNLYVDYSNYISGSGTSLGFSEPPFAIFYGPNPNLPDEDSLIFIRDTGLGGMQIANTFEDTLRENSLTGAYAICELGD